MKKNLLPILILIMFIPFYVNAETCDTDRITISSITIEEKSENVEELESAKASGKNINLNLSMSQVGDNVKYKITIKNDSNEDYILDKNSFNLNSDYIDYILDSEDDSNIIKANSSKKVILKVEYKKEVPEDRFENGSYNDNKNITMQLSNGNTPVPDRIKNPNTGVQSYVLLFLIIILIAGSLYVLLKKKKYAKYMIFIIGIAIIPISVYALCKCEIKVESKVKIARIEEFKTFCYVEYYGVGIGKKIPFNYKENETFNDFLERENDFEYINATDFYFIPNSCFTIGSNNTDVEVDDTCFNSNWGVNTANRSSLILNESEGCYFSGGG